MPAKCHAEPVPYSPLIGVECRANSGIGLHRPDWLGMLSMTAQLPVGGIFVYRAQSKGLWGV